MLYISYLVVQLLKSQNQPLVANKHTNSYMYMYLQHTSVCFLFWTTYFSFDPLYYKMNSGCRLICCADWTDVDKQPAVRDLHVLLWTLDCWQHTISQQQSLKSKICSIFFQETYVFYLQNKFHQLIFKRCGETWLGNTDGRTDTHNNYRMPPGLSPPRHNDSKTNWCCLLCLLFTMPSKAVNIFHIHFNILHHY